MASGLRSLLALVTISLLATAAPAHAGTRRVAFEQALLHRINDVRLEYGLAPLTLSQRLSAAALQHTEEMGDDGYFAHESVDRSDFATRVRRWYPVIGRGFWAVGENLLWSAPDVGPAGAVSIWLASPEHRANLLSPTWREIGLSAVHFASAPGVYAGRPVTIVTADFGARS